MGNRTRALAVAGSVSALAFFAKLKWIDGRPLLPLIEPYRRRLFERAEERDETGRLRYNLVLDGRGKKNWKSTDLVLGGFHAVLDDSPHGNQCYHLANDEDQAADDLELAKLLIKANPESLGSWLKVGKKIIERKDGRGYIEILPAGDAVGAHGKTFKRLSFDELHGYRNWDILEALQPDPHRLDSQMWITSYASIYHTPGVPLFDLTKIGRAGTDPRMLFSWYAADYTTDPDFADCDPETRANPSRSSWPDQGYLEQQKRRLPSHKYRRLHLNLPGLPAGSAYQPEPIDDAITRGVLVRPPKFGVQYRASFDGSGGSEDDATCSVSHYDEATGMIVVDLVMNQGQPAPFDPRAAIDRFAPVLHEYRIVTIIGDRYAGQTFRADFARHGISYVPCRLTTSELYEWMEPILNGRRLLLPDAPTLEQQLLGLVWRGSKITHLPGEHDDWATAVAGAVHAADKNAKNPAVAFITLGDLESGRFREHLDACAAADAARIRAGTQDAYLHRQATGARAIEQQLRNYGMPGAQHYGKRYPQNYGFPGWDQPKTKKLTRRRSRWP